MSSELKNRCWLLLCWLDAFSSAALVFRLAIFLDRLKYDVQRNIARDFHATLRSNPNTRVLLYALAV